MYRLYFLLLLQLLFIGSLHGQNQFNQQHEKFIRLHRSADPETLLSIFQKEEKLFRQQKPKPSDRYEAKLALDRGIYFYMIDEYEKSIVLFERAAKLNSITSNRDKILLYTYLGVSYRNKPADFKKAHLYIDLAIELAKKEKDRDLLASAIIKKAAHYYAQDQFNDGVRLLESFLKEEAKSLSLERRISIHALLGEGSNKLGIYSKSYANFTTAIELAKKTNNEELIADQYHNFILYFLNKNRYEEAKEQLFNVLRLLKDKPGVDKKRYDSYAILGQIYSSLNQPDSALHYANKSLDYALKAGDEENLSIAYATLGHIYSDMEEYGKALKFLLKSAEYEERLVGASVGTSEVYYNIGVVYLKMKNYLESIVYFEKSNGVAYLERDINILNLNYGGLAKAHYGLGNFKQVVAMQDSAFLYYDSLNNIEKNRELFQHEVRYKTKFREQENELLKLEVKRQNYLKEKEKEARRDTILFGLGLIILLLGIVYVLFVNNRLKKSKVAEAVAKIQNQKLEEELLRQRLSSLTEEINRKNKLIQSLESETSSATEENLINKVTLENDWLAFMSEFDKIHHGYLAELKQQFPTLSTNNLRLAALVKLEFSNKEIANVLCITENGVKKAKQRLKERMKMD